MGNLLLKDLFLNRYSILLSFVVFALTLANEIDTLYCFFLTLLFLIGTFTQYDGLNKVDMLVNALPYSRKQIVSSQYIGVIVCITSMLIVLSGALYVINFLFDQSFSLLSLKNIGLLYAVALLDAAFFVPISYIVSPKYLLLSFAIFGLLTGIIIVPAMRFYEDYVLKFIANYGHNLYYISGSIAILLFLLSWFFTIQIYKRKDV
ncbi:ABC-2 transporter permease [Priestia filamentosa]|uniref:ABC-2 transporter permease n=1 Tax=Priestia filamentosa TaxID=1402861 RepID=UPI00031E70B9|nr:ABC-2 transporter permease [Priestia filamentosa]